MQMQPNRTTRDPRRVVEEPKHCPRCKEIKPRSAFQTSRRKDGSRDGLQTYCRTCHREYQRSWYLRNRTKSMAASRRSVLRRFYGLDEHAWNELWESQNGKCLITGRNMVIGSKGRDRPCVDHYVDADGNPRVRGLITHAANAAIALLDHDPETLKRAHDYLVEHGY